MKKPKPEEGNTCPVAGCVGILWYEKVVGCTCHMGHPPCGRCVENPLACAECGWTEGEEEV